MHESAQAACVAAASRLGGPGSELRACSISATKGLMAPLAITTSQSRSPSLAKLPDHRHRKRHESSIWPLGHPMAPSCLSEHCHAWQYLDGVAVMSSSS